MGAIPVVPAFPAGTLTASAALDELCTAITWCLSGRPLCQLTKTGTQSIPNSTQTAIQWGTRIVDRDGGWALATQTEYIAQTPGIYKVSAFVPWAADSIGSRRLTFQVNTGSNNPAGSGNTTLFGTSSMVSSSASLASCTASSALTPYMYDGDFLQVLAWQDSTGALSTINSSDFGPPIWTIGLVSG